MLVLRLFQVALYSSLFSFFVNSAPTSPNDPFRVIVLRIPKQPEPPMCCLKPLAPIELVEDETLLSFEEWKARQSELQAKAKQSEGDAVIRLGSAVPNDGTAVGENGIEPAILATNNPLNGSGKPGSAPTQDDIIQDQYIEPVSPHFQVPLTDRFNYASLDCSARVHTAHRSAKSMSSILSSKRDRYMLSPCNASNKEKQFVIVELCDDIRIDTVQLANFEFFSGVFKDFSVSVAKTYNAGGWTHAGTYKAKNVRGVQSFHPPTSLRDFYRYIRIDFISHYGSEYYCPVSLLRVYGLTHLEQWKWDIWEAEGGAKQPEPEKVKRAALPSESPPPEPVTSISTTISPSTVISGDLHKSISGVKDTSSRQDTSNAVTTSQIIYQSSRVKSPTAAPEPSTADSIPLIDQDITYSASHNLNDYHDTSEIPEQHHVHSTATPVSSSASSVSFPSSSTAHHFSASSPDISGNLPVSSPTKTSINNSATETATHNNSNVSSTRRPSASTTSIATVAATAASPPPVLTVPVVPSAPTGGESIYRTIMNRLSALEANHTLYTRYMEQQNGAIRELIKRLGEDVGRLEGITRAQGLMYQRTVSEWDKQRHQMMMDYGQLISRIEHLSEEVVLEKRLGVAQLSLLLAVLIFMGLTRGSRGESIVVNDSVRAWGKRHLSLSGDWTTRFTKKSISPVRPKPQSARPIHAQVSKQLDDLVQFPKKESWKKTPLEPIQLNTAPLPSEYRNRTKDTTSHSRSRTPSLRTSAARRTPNNANLQRPVTPTPTRIRSQPMQRSISHSANAAAWSAQGPKSARKWARTAHLHEVKTAAHSHPHVHPHANVNVSNSGSHSKPRRTLEVNRHGGPLRSESDRENEDVFSAPAGSSNFVYRTIKHSPIQASSPEMNEKASSNDEGQRRQLPDAGKLMLKPEEGEGDIWIDTDSIGGSDGENGSDVDPYID